MVKTRRSSAATSNKRPSSSSPSPAHTPSGKRAKSGATVAKDEEETSELVAAESPENDDAASEEKGQEEQMVKILSPVNPSKKRAAKPPRSSKLPWGKLLSQCSQNPHLPIYGPLFTVGYNTKGNLQLGESSISTPLCKLKHEEQGGASVASLEIIGSQGVVQVNGKTIERNSNVILTAGDEVVFNSSGKHAYIFQQLSTVTPVLPSHSITEAEGLPIKGIHFQTGSVDPSVDDEASLLASFSNLSKDLSVAMPQPANGSSSPDLDLGGSIYKMFEYRSDFLKDNSSSLTLASTRSQAFKDSLKRGILSPSDIEVSFECFPYYLSDNTKSVLLSCAYIHLECKVKVVHGISSLSQRTLLSGPAGSEIYQESLAKALAKHFDSRLLIVDSLLLQGSRSPHVTLQSPLKDSESLKESIRAEMSGFFLKQQAGLANTSTIKRPASSVEAVIAGTSNSQSLPKQETSTASSKACTFKEGDRVRYVGSLQSRGYPLQPQKGPNCGYRGKVLLAFEENGFSKIGVRFDKQIPEGNDLGGLCEEDHGFFCSADLLRPEYPGCESTEVINELIEVVSEESKGGSLIIFLKDVEKCIMGGTESYLTLKSKLDLLPAGVFVIGSHTQADGRKEKSNPGGLLFTKFGSSRTALLDLFPDYLTAPKSRTPEEMDAGWKHGKCVNPNNKRRVECDYCSKIMDGGVTRLKQHLAGISGNVSSCPGVPPAVRKEMLLLVEGKKKDKIIADQRKQRVEEELTRIGGRVDSSSEEENDGFAELRRDVRESRREHAAEEWGRRRSVGDRETGSSRGPALGGRSKSVAYRGEEVRNIPEVGVRDLDPYVLRKQGAMQPKIKGAIKGIKNAKNHIGRFISKFFIYNNISFIAAKSPHYQPMIDAIAASGSGVKGPTPYEISNTYLDMEINDIEEYLKSFHRYWDEYGCTIMCDGWSTQNRKCIINFLVYSPQGTIFLKSVDASDKYKDSKYIFGLMNEVVEQIGENRVVQIITDNGSNYKKAGMRLMEVRKNLYWTPCAAHCIDLMLKDIANDPHIKPLIQMSQDMTCFIYNHGWALSIMRTETQNGELVRPAITRFATNFLALDSILKHEADLKRMINTRGWTDNYMKLNRKDREKANVVVGLIESQTYWRDIAGVTAIFRPLVKVLRMVDSDDKAEMGHLYEAMDRAKEMIKKNVGQGHKKWWKMIDTRWNSQLHRDIHAAGYFLNPKYQYSNNVVNDDEVLNGFHRVVNRMVNDNTTRLNINKEAERFRLRAGDFNSVQMQSAVNKCLPAEWWSIHGRVEAPNLTRLAIRILSQTVSSSNCERNWTTFSLIHTRPRNRLLMTKLEKLVFVHYNMRLRVRNMQRSKDEKNVIDLDEIFHDEDPLVAWTRERETPLLDGRENEWLDDNLDVDPQDTAENARRPGKRKKTPDVQSRQVDSDKDSSTDSGGNGDGPTYACGADNTNEYESPGYHSHEYSEDWPSDYQPREPRMDDAYAGGSSHHDVPTPSDNYNNTYDSSSTSYYPYSTQEAEQHSTFDGLMTSFFHNTDISLYYPHNQEPYQDDFDNYEPF